LITIYIYIYIYVDINNKILNYFIFLFCTYLVNSNSFIDTWYTSLQSVTNIINVSFFEYNINRYWFNFWNIGMVGKEDINDMIKK
jgi:hypothetical protein